MKKLFRNSIILALFVFTAVFAAKADEISDVKAFFDSYVKAANSYSPDLTSYYSPSAKIIRYVVQKDGSVYPVPLVTNMNEYTKQLKMSSKVAKIRDYKNFYTDIKITKQNDNFKLSASRRPSTSDYTLPSYFIIAKSSSGKYQIVEEMMQTKEQILLKHIKG